MNITTSKVVMRELARHKANMLTIQERLKEIAREREALEADLRYSRQLYAELQDEMPGMPPIERYLLACAAQIDEATALSIAGVSWREDIAPLLKDEEFLDRQTLAARPPHRYVPPIEVRLSGTDLAGRRR